MKAGKGVEKGVASDSRIRCTDKKENKISPIYEVIQMGSVAKSGPPNI
jgi:hypothetical protein